MTRLHRRRCSMCHSSIIQRRRTMLSYSIRSRISLGAPRISNRRSISRCPEALKVKISLISLMRQLSNHKAPNPRSQPASLTLSSRRNRTFRRAHSEDLVTLSPLKLISLLSLKNRLMGTSLKRLSLLPLRAYPTSLLLRLRTLSQTQPLSTMCRSRSRR